MEKLLLFLALFVHLHGVAQPNSTQYFETIHLFNPAATAYKHSYSGTLFYRNQRINWPGNLLYFLGTFEMDLDKINSGVGINVVNEQIGLNSNTQAGANYRYSFGTGDHSRISIGTSFNYVNAQVNGDFIFPDGTTINERSQAHGFSAHAGLLFEVKGFIAGLSVFNLK
jgi:type IX secretion system PorP/SprF family membrane protein